MVLWYPKFWRMDGRRQKGSSLSRVLKRMEALEGPHGMYGTVFGEGRRRHFCDSHVEPVKYVAYFLQYVRGNVHAYF